MTLTRLSGEVWGSSLDFRLVWSLHALWVGFLQLLYLAPPTLENHVCLGKKSQNYL